jgi:hypothetical protein
MTRSHVLWGPVNCRTGIKLLSLLSFEIRNADVQRHRSTRYVIVRSMLRGPMLTIFFLSNGLDSLSLHVGLKLVLGDTHLLKATVGPLVGGQTLLA